MLRNLLKALKPKQYEVVQIENGSKVIFSPEGTEYSQNRLKKLYDPAEKCQWFSITPVCQFQKNRGWPDAPSFVNVNTPGSIETEKENWLGYIGAWEDDGKQSYVVDRLNTILKTKRPMLYGKIVKESDGEYRIIFFVSRKSLDNAAK